LKNKVYGTVLNK